MDALFAPAIGLMNRLRFPKKFALLGLVVVVNVVILLYSLVSVLNASIDYARREMDGIKAVIPVMKLVQATQQHRGLSSSVINGAADLEEKRKAKQGEVAALVAQVDAAISPAVRGGEAWKKIVGDWKDVEATGMEWTSAQSFKVHTDTIEDLLTFQINLADESGLVLDPDADSYYLMDAGVFKMPALFERLGRLRARGAGVLAQKKTTAQNRIDLGILEAEVTLLLKGTETSVRKVIRHAPSLDAKLTEAVSNLTDVSEKVLQVVSSDIIHEQFSTSAADYFKLATTAIDGGYKELYDTVYPALNQLLEERIVKAQRSRNLNLLVCLVAFVVLCYLMIGASIAISRNLAEMSSAAGRMADGDLRTPVSLRSDDELKDVANRLNEMVSAFNGVLRNVQSSAGSLLGAAQQMTRGASQIADSSRQQSEAASSMAAAVEETTVGVDHIASNAQDASGISTRAGELSAQGGKIVATVADEMNLIAEAVNQSATTIEELGEQSKQISAIVGTIKEIADQTNLLALNAAIEAARAGESGRGFAVVADEVRKLAERTARSTQEISGMVDAIQSGTERAVASMKNGVARVTEGVVMAGRAGAAMTEIQSGAAQVVQVVGDMSTALREQSTASADMSRHVEQIARMAEDNSNSISGNAATAGELEQLASRLQGEIARFKVA
jgi:methyl-accepting chemotaxis protein